MLKNILWGLLNLALAILFIFSAYTKLYPIEPFEFTFVDLGVSNWQIAPVMARAMIGLEFMIGILLILNIQLKKFTYPLTVGVLVFFIIYLLVQIFTTGNNGNCGCFGQVLVMTPLQAIIKNIVMVFLVLLLRKYYTGFEIPKFKSEIKLVSIAFAFVLPYMLNPVQYDYSEAYLNRPDENFELPADTIYKNAVFTEEPPDFKSGKHIMAFLSLSCQHCRIAAKKLRIMLEKNPGLPVYFILNGEKEKLKSFFDDTKAEGIPHCILNGKGFVFLAGTELPVIYLVNKSMVEHDISYFDLDQKYLEEWLKKP